MLCEQYPDSINRDRLFYHDSPTGVSYNTIKFLAPHRLCYEWLLHILIFGLTNECLFDYHSIRTISNGNYLKWSPLATLICLPGQVQTSTVYWYMAPTWKNLKNHFWMNNIYLSVGLQCCRKCKILARLTDHPWLGGPSQFGVVRRSLICWDHATNQKYSKWTKGGLHFTKEQWRFDISASVESSLHFHSKTFSAKLKASIGHQTDHLW